MLKKIEEADSYFFHLWSAMKRHTRFYWDKIDEDSAYIHLAKKYCPRVYEVISKT